jgi:hypothetical protein
LLAALLGFAFASLLCVFLCSILGLSPLRSPPTLSQDAAPPAAEGAAGGSGALGPGARVALAQPGVARLVINDEGPEPIADVHHCMANRRDLHAKKPADEAEQLEEELAEVAVEAAGVMEFPIACAELLDILLATGGGQEEEAVAVGELPEPEGDDNSAGSVVAALVEAGVLAVQP